MNRPTDAGGERPADRKILTGVLRPLRRAARLKRRARQRLAVLLPECEHLGRRTEWRAGCSGWMCAHQCDHPEEALRAQHPVAVPGGNCQTCPNRPRD